jgi:preprotein translocase subunit SecG
MSTIILVIHLIIAVALVAVVLLQRSEGGALGIGGGGGGGMSGFLTGRSTANLLTRTTAILAALFVITSLTLAKLSGGGVSRSIFEQAPVPQTTAPAPSEAVPAPPPEAPSAPSAPLAR